MKKLFLVFIFLSAFVSCGEGTKETDKCDGVTCSAHGTCVVENNSAKCDCETGYSADGLNCIADIVDLCLNVTCDEWKECNPSNGACVLKSGRCDSESDCSGDLKCDENHTCHSSTNPCENNTCATELKVCDGMTGECLDLCAYANCDAATQDCNWQFGTCVAKGDLCATDTTCAAQNKVCTVVNNAVVCKEDCTVSGCTAGLTCNTNTKVCENLCTDVQCCEGKTCNPANGQCEGTCTSISTITAVRSEGIAVSDTNSATPSIGEVTDIEGVVVAIKGMSTSSKHGVFIRQANATEFAGIYVDFYAVKSDPTFVTPAIGDLIKVSGLHKEYFGFSQIIPSTVAQIVVVTNGFTVPASIDITVEQIQEKYESMLVNLTGGPFTVTEEGTAENFYNTKLTNVAGIEFQMKSDVMYPKYVLPVGTVLTKATGVVTFDYGYFKLLPRNAADLGQVNP